MLDNNIISIDKLVKHFIHFSIANYKISQLAAFLKYLKERPKYINYYYKYIDEIIIQVDKHFLNIMLLEIVVNTGKGLDLLINNLYNHPKLDNVSYVAFIAINYVYENYFNNNREYKLNLLECIILKNYNIDHIIGLLVYYKKWYKESNPILYKRKLAIIQKALISQKSAHVITYFIKNAKEVINREEVTKEMEDIILDYDRIQYLLEYLDFNPIPYNTARIIEILKDNLKSQKVKNNLKISRKIKYYIQRFEKLQTISVSSFMEYASNNSLNENLDIAKYTKFFNKNTEETVGVTCTLQKRQKNK